MSNPPSDILLVHGHDCPRLDIRAALASRYAFIECHLDELANKAPAEAKAIVIDVPLETAADANRVRAALARLPCKHAGQAFIIDDLSRAAIVRSHALGAELIISRPLDAHMLFSLLDLLLTNARHQLWSSDFRSEIKGLEAGTMALEAIFQIASCGNDLTQDELFEHGDTIIDTLGATGLGRWIEAVKLHHSQTFRHCLLVTGVAVGFGQSLGMRHEDLRRLTLGGLLHDIGKSAIPVEILEKSSNLTDTEMAVMREHVTIGRAILENQRSFSDEMIDVVAHHHEYLDGSGYPDQLLAPGISDLVRVMTISDIFSALIEHRPYKPSMPNKAAYDILARMEGKVDMDLLHAFEPLAMRTRLVA